ncbi:MAG: 50S ribosomal protein L5 [Bdellovibrionaceae bacterium]|nr:50S ribosomal protein L5 [Pseudobdellovibrionaceae bacterium]
MSYTKNLYDKEVVPALKKELNTENIMKVPTIEKIVINTCISEAVQNPKLLNVAVDELSAITGQKAVVTKAKKAIANFKLREGMPLGARVTLRREKAWAFMDRLVHLALPSVRDFRGISPKGFDGRGNYNMGVKEQIIFPEISYDKVDKVRGMNITICTTAKTDAEGKALLEKLGMPFRSK